MNNNAKKQSGLKLIWELLFPAIIFMFAIIIFTIYFSVQLGNNPGLIERKIQDSIPYILFLSQAILLLYFLFLKRKNNLSMFDLGWTKEGVGKEIVIGSSFGIALAALYFSFISDVMIILQKTFGDYVPPGELFTALGTAEIPFFLANVIFAPFVEENFYRGYAMYKLKKIFSTPVSFILCCTFFGLFHWAGGFWYIIITGFIAGTVFLGLLLWRKSIIAPFAAHFTLNLIEYIVIAIK